MHYIYFIYHPPLRQFCLFFVLFCGPGRLCQLLDFCFVRLQGSCRCFKPGWSADLQWESGHGIPLEYPPKEPFYRSIIWVFPKIEVPQNGGFLMENPIKMDDLGGKPTIFRKHPYIIPRFHGCTEIQKHWVEIWCLSDIDNMHIVI